MIKVHVVPHSHWDREWYFNIEDSNILLGENLTHLVGFLENNEDYSSYTFDAQGSILEEYIKLYPENRDRLKKLIEKRRLFVGPWYTQTDSLLVNKESIIRNLQYGIDVCEEYGYSMKVGYLPDIFGQNQYLPSIFKGFGINNAIFQRGIYTDRLKENLNMRWVSPDMEEVRANNIYLGYGPGKFLEAGDEYIEEKLLPMLEKLKKLNKDCNHLLLPAGGDQVLVREHFKEVVDELNRKNLGYEFVLSNYEDFMDQAWEEKIYDNLVEGELRDTEKSRIHRTIGSSRYDIKEANSRVENKLIRILEPLGVIGQETGIEYPKRWIDIAWKLLFDVHAHDSIGGCNSDTTNSDVLDRLERVERIVDAHINIIKKKIVSGISKKLNREDIITIFNTEAAKLTNTEVVVFTRKNKPTIQTLDGKEIKGEILESEYISGGRRVVVTAEGDREEEIPGYYRSIILLPDLEIPSLGYKTFAVTDEAKEIKNLESEDKYIENNYYRLEVVDGKIKLFNKRTKEEVDDLIYFESNEDGGDSYDYSPVEGDTPVCFNNFRVVKVKKSENKEVLELVSLLDSPRRFEIETTILLDRESNLMKISHNLDNTEENHRLRAVIRSEVESNFSYSDSGFSLVKHSNTEEKLKNWRENKYAEAPVTIYNLENLVVLKDEKHQLAVYAEGIKEYQVIENNLALTLFRSTGLLGRDNLMWRPGRASGINNKVVTTPDAQLKKRLGFRYGVVIGEKLGVDEVYRGADEFLRKTVSYQLQDLNTFEERLERFEIPRLLEETPDELSLINIENKNVFISTIKKEHRGEGTVIRVFNPSDRPEKIEFKGSVKRVNLKEEIIEEVNQHNINAKSYATFKIERS